MRWAGHVARMAGIINAVKRRQPLVTESINARVRLKWITHMILGVMAMNLAQDSYHAGLLLRC